MRKMNMHPAAKVSWSERNGQCYIIEGGENIKSLLASTSNGFVEIKVSECIQTQCSFGQMPEIKMLIDTATFTLVNMQCRIDWR